MVRIPQPFGWPGCPEEMVSAVQSEREGEEEGKREKTPRDKLIQRHALLPSNETAAEGRPVQCISDGHLT